MNALGEIKKSLWTDRLAHAYMLEAPAGETRDRLVTDILQAILCQNPNLEQRPCGLCEACRRVAAGSHEDVIYMKKSKLEGKTKAGKVTYVLADVKPFMDRLRLNPYGERNIGLIPDADDLKEDVQNKILKTLEEPYPGTVIFLVAENRNNLLPTIQSRCVLLRETEEPDAAETSALEEIWNQKYFFQYRKMVEKKLKSADDALKFLDVIEREAHEEHRLEMILRIEETRKDILGEFHMGGMNWKYALKRLFLEVRE